MKKLLLICFILVVALLTSCDDQKRECVIKASKCLTDEAYRDSLYKGWKAPINKDSLVDSVFAMLREQRQILLNLNAEKNAAAPASVEEKSAPEIQPVIETPNAAPVVENVEELVREESANEVANVASEPVVNEQPKNPEIQPKESKWGKLLTGAGAAIAGAAVGVAVVDKLVCKERLDITVEYKLMVACLNSCGYDEETLEKCGAGIMQWLCKEKEKAETIMNRVSNSCVIK
ncbi:hypothetical protein [Hallerella porci]|uniref:Lipoprotein n=1 Tax=Hallerella porci TaxID=1945871 RepID=A0ABX5LHD7_9BACT|nr:hypothetical protein [Hallerella porci]PWK86600.1 hypothetical protein B0H50_1473 [Hallerella porci]